MYMKNQDIPDCEGFCYLLLVEGYENKKKVKEICGRKPPLALVFEVMTEIDKKLLLKERNVLGKISKDGRKVHVAPSVDSHRVDRFFQNICGSSEASRHSSSWRVFNPIGRRVDDIAFT
eukprot:Trichotokara_eunicae@DN6659_c0_g1_i1.p2